VNRADFTGTIGSSGGVAIPLPSGAVANNRVPVVACYVSNNRQTWLVVTNATDNTSWPACGLTGIGTASPGLALINVPVGYFYYIIVAW
jgi:hypothetical protein